MPPKPSVKTKTCDKKKLKTYRINPEDIPKKPKDAEEHKKISSRMKKLRARLQLPENAELLEKFKERDRLYSKRYREKQLSDPKKALEYKRKKALESAESRRRKKLREGGKVKPIKPYKPHNRNTKKCSKIEKGKITEAKTNLKIENPEIDEELMIKTEELNEAVPLVVQSWAILDNDSTANISENAIEEHLQRLPAHGSEDSKIFFGENVSLKEEIMTLVEEPQKRSRKKIDLNQRFVSFEPKKPKKSSLRTVRCAICNIFINKVRTCRPYNMKKRLVECENCHQKRMKEKREASKVKMTCDICGEVRFTKQSIEMHVERHLNLTCDVCKQPCLNRIDLRRHLRLHIDSFCCEECGTRFNDKSEFKRHKEMHEELENGVKKRPRQYAVEDKVIPCSFCPNKFKSLATLKGHVDRMHADGGEKNAHKCKSCDKVFFTRDDLRVHSFEHYTGVIKYCDFPGCGKPFKKTKLLTIHRKIHQPPKYECKDCGQKFFGNSGRNKHYKRKSCLKYKITRESRLLNYQLLRSDENAMETAKRQLESIKLKKFNRPKSAELEEESGDDEEEAALDSGRQIEMKSCDQLSEISRNGVKFEELSENSDEEEEEENSEKSFGIKYKENFEKLPEYRRNSAVNYGILDGTLVKPANQFPEASVSNQEDLTVKVEPEFFEIEVKEEPIDFKEESTEFFQETSQNPYESMCAFEIKDEKDEELMISTEPLLVLPRLKLKTRKIAKCSVCKEVKCEEIPESADGSFTCESCRSARQVIKIRKIRKCLICKSLTLEASHGICQKCDSSQPVVVLTRLSPLEILSWTRKPEELAKLLKVRPRMKIVTHHEADCWCDLCGKKFKRCYLPQHFRLHQEAEELSPCNICGRVYSFKSKLKRHMILSHNVSYSCCHVCGKTLRSEKIEAHLQTHAAPTKCEICGKMVKFMKPHLMAHKTASKPKESMMLPCPTCGKLIFRHSLQKHIDCVHLKISTGAIYQCDKCEANFTRNDDLRRHKYRTHLEKIFECIICDGVFKTRKALRNHRFSHNPLRIKCEDCGKVYSRKSALYKHRKLKHGKKETEDESQSNLEAEKVE